LFSKVKVSVVKGDNPIIQTVKALRMIEAEKAFSLDDKVLIKPNYVVAKDPLSGVTTDGRVVEGVVKFLREMGVKTIMIGEGSGFSDTFEAFRLAGIDKVAERYNVRLIDLNKDRFVEVEIKNALALKKVKIAQTALESIIVSVPKLKVHSMAEVTLSLKNMMGAIYPKNIMHGNLHKKIVDLASILKPRLAVVDGIIGGAGGELGSTPIKMGLVVAGLDPVAVDAVSSAIIGKNPSKIGHIVWAEKVGLGVGNLEKIEVVGEKISKVEKNFDSVLSQSYSKFLKALDYVRITRIYLGFREKIFRFQQKM